MIKPLRNKILFCFLNELSSDGLFKDETESGIQIIENHNDTANRGRWGRVLAIGPEVKDIKNGDYIMPEPLMYTNGFEHDGIKIWQTDESKIMMISDEVPNIKY